MNTTPRSKSYVRFLPVIVRILMGLPLFLFGLNAFLHFIPEPKPVLPPEVIAFITALKDSGYMLKLIGATHLIVGALLLVNRFVPLALALFAPFMVNSVAFHLCLERSGLPMALVFAGFELYLAWVYRAAFRPMLAARVTPN